MFTHAQSIQIRQAAEVRFRLNAQPRGMIVICGLLLSGLSASAQRPPDIQLNAGMNREVVEGVIKVINRYYVSAEVAKELEAGLRAHLNNGDYDKITSAYDLMDALDAHMERISKDKHLKLAYSYEPGKPFVVGQDMPPDSAEDLQKDRAAARTANFGFEKLERLAGNIGYLNIGGFHRPEFTGEMTGAVMTFLANSDALIIDLRNSRGGSADMVLFLASYFFPGEEQVYLGDWDCRAENRSQQWWTLPYVPGPRYLGRDVYILVSGRTFSAPEGLASFLQHHKRAVIVGEQTVGGTHPGHMLSVHPHFAVFVPAYRVVYPAGAPSYPLGRPVYPETKTDYEGVGVKPDLACPAAQALKTAHLDALKKKLVKFPDQKEKLEPLIARLGQELRQ